MDSKEELNTPTPSLPLLKKEKRKREKRKEEKKNALSSTIGIRGVYGEAESAFFTSIPGGQGNLNF